jgi:sugar lactone lactonase YvrE
MNIYSKFAATLTLLLTFGKTTLAADINFSAKEAYPEGIAYLSKDDAFLVSSIRKGTIGKVTKSGKYQSFINDEKLISSLGLLLDEKRNNLWVAICDLGLSTHSSEATKTKLAAVATYDATTGKRKAYYDLSNLIKGMHLANDLTMDSDGNVYVTDSFSPAIYKIDTNGNSTIFASSELFKGEGVNLNGITYHPDGYLLTIKYNSGELFRVDIKNPKKISKIQLNETIKGGDGLILTSNNQLFVVQNQGNDSVIELTSTDGWRKAEIKSKKKTSQSFPTTGIKVKNSIFVLNGRLDSLLDEKAQKVNNFSIQEFKQ